MASHGNFQELEEWLSIQYHVSALNLHAKDAWRFVYPFAQLELPASFDGAGKW